MAENYEKYKGKMDKVVSVYEEDLKTIRAGRATPAVLDKVMVDYYGTPTPIVQLGSISVPEPRMLLIQPWDATATSAIEKAIQKSELGLTPANDGKAIRLSFPPLTEERRKELVKTVKKRAEEAKVAVRTVRRDAIEDYKELKKKSEITEDDLKNIEKDIQNMTDKFVKELDALAEAKEKEILEV